MRYLYVLLSAIVITGCAHKREVRSYRIHGEACQSLGFKSGSDDWADCTQALERARLSRQKSVEMETSGGKTLTCSFAKRPTVCE